MNASSRAREVIVSCPYWIVNKTNLTLRFKDTTFNASQPLTAAPGLGGQADPLLFRYQSVQPLAKLLCVTLQLE